MSLTPTDIIARLDPINTLIESIFKQLLIGQTGPLIKIKESLERWINTSKSNDEIPELNEATLQEFITNANETILKYLDAAAHYYRLTWSSQLPIETTLTIEWVDKQWKSFIFLITPAIPQPQPQSRKHRNHVVQFFDRDDITQLRNPLLNLQLQRLKLFLKEAQETHNELTAQEQAFKKPPTENISTSKFFSYLTQYQSETSKAHQIIREISGRIEAHTADIHDELLVSLGRSLCIAIQVVQTCNSERQQIAKMIEAIYPQTNDQDELIDMQHTGLDLLKNKLEALLLVFIQINVKKDNVEMQFFTKILLDFVNSLTEALTTGKHPLGDTDTVKLLKKELCHHLSKSSHLLDFEAKTPTLEATPSYILTLTQNDLTQIMIEPNELVVKIEKDDSLRSWFKSGDHYVLKYAVIDPGNNRQIETITASHLPFLSSLSPTTPLNELTQHLPELLTVTARKKHTKNSLEVLLKKLFQSSFDEKPTLLDGWFSKLKKETSDNIITLRKDTIARIRYTLRTLNEFPIDKIATCFLIQANIEQQRTCLGETNALIRTEIGQLQFKITEFLKKIAIQVAPIPTKGFDTNLQPEANDRSNQLYRLQASLSVVQQTFETNALLEQAPIEIKSLEQIAQLQQSTEVLLEKQKNILTELIKLKHEIKENEVEALLSNLIDFYQKKIKEFQTELNTEINETQAALLFEAKQQKPTPTITETLREHHNFVLALETRKDSLALIREEHKQHVTKLKELTKTVKDSVLKEISPAHEALTKTINEVYTKKEIIGNSDENNPFCDDLIEAAQQCQQSFNQYNGHIKQLSNTPGTKLLEWYKQHNDYKNKVTAQLNIYKTLTESINVIENRLKTDGYISAGKLLTQLKVEYVRIFNKYIDSRRTKKLSLEQITELKQTRDSLIQDPESMKNLGFFDLKQIEASLNLIDPRLNKLISIYSDFKETNKLYISKNPQYPNLPSSLNDKAYCNQLIDKVTAHLRNPKMETLSDGVNSQFFQWIRRHILKPLENLVHRLTHIFTQTRTAHFFTVGACATEKTLVKLGNDYYQQLSPPMNS